ncbi:hypothetical protein CAPTEDRAFT_208757 [Capitella teleta]|uniref:Carbohydrate sulfotransferase n=1 Tax=Capitella teleta TaxID=283909 RepID=R7TXE4_CAPTE|nr:hypothetical protein CAPTEDRAFT_208757 [Capitella teleta]|eukprot:ELT96116.1 hypothetical protein CAPTEDRAFT_208757 [Capitella teleta]
MGRCLKLPPRLIKALAVSTFVILIIEVTFYRHSYMERPWREKKQYLARYTSTRRAELLKELCGPRNYSMELLLLNNSSIFAQKKLGVLFCVPPKAGTSSWMLFLQRFASGSDNEYIQHPHTRSFIRERGIKPIEAHRLPKEYFGFYKLLQVRHPFTRLISAYNDKVFHRDGEIDESGRGRILCNAFKKGLSPTWVQFAELVANRNSSCMNKHWMPYSKVCPVCDMEFDAVTKIETISADVNDFFKRHNISDKFHFDQYHVSTGEPGKTTEDYMNELPEDVLTKLKMMFKTDMELFGYEIDSDRRLSCRYQVRDAEQWRC